MHTPPHSLGLERVAEVFSGHDDVVGVTGSAYAIGPDLVLTSGQVVDSGGPCHVRPAWSDRWLPAVQVWRGRGGADAVLLRVSEPAWASVAGIEHTRWGRVAGTTARCVASGFGQAGERGPARPPETVTGLVDPPAGLVSRALTARVVSPDFETRPVALWHGLPGAALLAEPAGQIVGVVAAYAPRRFDVVPVSALVSDERFRELTGVAPWRVEAVSAAPAIALRHLLVPARTPTGPLSVAQPHAPATPTGAPLMAAPAYPGSAAPPGPPDAQVHPPSPDPLVFPRPEGSPGVPGAAGWAELAAGRAVVPFLGRERPLGELRAWAGEASSLSIAVLTGRGGTGKTRLAGELCAELEALGWDAGFLPLDTLAAVLSAPHTGDLRENGTAGQGVRLEAVRPTLIVLDGPEASPPLVGELVRRLARHGRNPRVRLLLVAREPGDGDWWRRLDTAAGGRLRRLNTTTVQLNAHPLTLPERRQHALAAMRAFTSLSATASGPSEPGLTLPDLTLPDLTGPDPTGPDPTGPNPTGPDPTGPGAEAALLGPPRLDDPEYGLPLHVHLAALLRLDGAPHVSGEELIGRFLTREWARWLRLWPDDPNRPDDATAHQPGAHERSSDAIAHQPGAHERPGEAAVHLPEEHERPGVAPGHGPQRDDRSGDVLAPEPGAFEWFESRAERRPEGLRRLGELAAWQAVAVLVLTEPRADELPALLTAVPGIRTGTGGVAGEVARWLGRLGVPAQGFDVVAELLLDETEDLDALVLAVHDHEARTTAHLVRMLDVLRLAAGRERVRAALWSLIASRIGRLVAAAVADPASRLGDVLNAALALFADDRQLAEAVAALPVAQPGNAGPGLRNGGLGLRALDVTLAELTVRHRRTTGERAALAGALAWWSRGLAAVGRVGEAVAAAGEAVEVYAGAPPYEDAAGHAEALFGLGAYLLLGGEAAGALKPAREAAARFSVLAEDDPRYAWPAARAQYNVACALLESGRLDEAVAAFEAAGGHPGFASYLTALLAVLPSSGPGPDATGLAAGNLAAGSGDRTSAPAPGPGGHATDGLAAWGTTGLTGTGRPTSASGLTGAGGAAAAVASEGAAVTPSGLLLAGAQEVVAGPEPLAPFDQVGTAEVLPELAGCLAVAVTSALRGVAPANRDVAHGLHLVAAWLETNGRRSEALAPAGEAVARLRGLAAEEPELRAMLASAASVVSRLHAGLDDLDAAIRAAAEAVRNLRSLVTLDPAEHRNALAGRLLDLGELLLADDRPDEALEPLQEAMAVPVEAVEGHRATQARGRRLLGLCLDGLGRTSDGLAQLEMAAELYDVLSVEDPSYRRYGPEVRARLRRGGEQDRPADEPWLLRMVLDRPEEAVARAERRLAECREAVESAGTPEIERIHAYLSAQADLARVWADTGRAGEGFALAMQAAELLERHAAPDRPHAIAVGMVAAALGRSLVGLGRYKEAIPHLLTAIEASLPQAGARAELAELLILETFALSRADCPSDADAAAGRLVELYTSLVNEGAARPIALAGALRLQAGIRFARQDITGALASADRALALLPLPADDDELLLAAGCHELAALCLAELHEPEAAEARLADGTAKLAARAGRVPDDFMSVHVLALVRLARLRVEQEGPSAGIELYARILSIRPLPEADALDALITAIEEYARDVRAAQPGDPDGCEPDAGAPVDIGGLVEPLAAFTEALEREVPLSGEGGQDVHDRYGRCLMILVATADRSAAQVAELAVRVYRGLAAVSPACRASLGRALAALAAARPALPVLEQAVALLDDRDPRLLAEILHDYAGALLDQGRAVEALAHCERAADLCDELDDPAVAAAVFARLGSALAALDRPQAALEAIAWSLAEVDRAAEEDVELPLVRARAIQVRGRVLRMSGRGQEALAHLVEALRLFRRLPEPQAAAETAALIADDLLAEGRPEQAVEYAEIAANTHEQGTVQRVLATQRLIRCHMMLGRLAEANTLVEALIPVARRTPGDLTFRAILADSLAQSSELLPLLGLDDGGEAEARAREAITVYDQLLAAGTNAQALHISRAGACLTLAGALRMRGRPAEAVQPLREAVAALERFSPGNPMQAGLLSRAMLMLGDALMEAGRALEAGLVFHRGTQVTRDPLARAVAHARFGACQQDLGRDDAADAALRVSADLLRGLPREATSDLLQDVLRRRLALLEKAGRSAEAQAIQDELARLAP
ncbi:tetratricopeptide repeat protein [Nonomuraea sp. N2-4H]|uniref:tetratricopeptide repeat protein n=1 Tax=Nonomuraea sp. N2-4H TaxID=3128898 RepID=UPI00324BC267